MASSVTEIFNQALSIAGISRRLASDQDKGAEAEECRYWFPIVRDKVLRAAPWPSARKEADLARIVDHTFGLPSDNLRPRYLTSFAQFQLGTYNDNQAVLTTSDPTPRLVYTFRQTNINMWDADLSLAISHALAAYVVSPLSGSVDRINFAIQAANNAIEEARVNASNEDMIEWDSVPPWIAVRGFSGDTHSMRFMYPHGGLVTFPAGKVK